jgi:hypothetical protein
VTGVVSQSKYTQNYLLLGNGWDANVGILFPDNARTLTVLRGLDA